VRLLILGRAGQLGGELMAQGPGQDFEVTGLGSDEVDVTDRASSEAAVAASEPQVVVNTTAYHVVPDCDLFPERAFGVNAAAVKTLAELCHGRGAGFVTFSTDYVFDGRKGAPYAEDDRPNPLQTYGVSKYAGELLSNLFHPGSLVIRTCGAYGGATGSRSKRGNFVLSILRQSETRSEIEVSSEQIVNPTYTGDLAAATLALLRHAPAPGVYHLAAEGHCSWAEFAAAIMELSGRPARILPVDHGGRSGSMQRPRLSALDNGKARALGVTLPHWKEGLRRYLARLAISAQS
jgi:dTDP-4-dehydrorhamnose reductase